MTKTINVYKIVGKNIRKRRLELNFSQKQVADSVGIDYSYFGRMERGEQPISLKRLFQIAGVLKTPVETLVKIPENTVETSKNISELIRDKSPDKVRLVEEIARVILKDEF
ncbi:MAG: helix-turn-helix transcriptional regulator [bacterium]